MIYCYLRAAVYIACPFLMAMRPVLLLFMAVLLPQLATAKWKVQRYDMRTEPYDSTVVQLWLSDTTGTPWVTNYDIYWIDTATREVVRQYPYRIDAQERPILISVPPGSYHVRLGEKGRPFLQHVPVLANRKNIIQANPPLGSLRFRYEDKPKRLMREYTARVELLHLNMEPRQQSCATEAHYQPGRYLVEVNTVPVSQFNVEIDWGSVTEIQLPESGTLQLQSKETVSSVTLYRSSGNRFVQFEELILNGKQARRQLQLKPGTYEAHWGTQVKRFKIVAAKPSIVVLD